MNTVRVYRRISNNTIFNMNIIRQYLVRTHQFQMDVNAEKPFMFSQFIKPSLVLKPYDDRNTTVDRTITYMESECLGNIENNKTNEDEIYLIGRVWRQKESNTLFQLIHSISEKTDVEKRHHMWECMYQNKWYPKKEDYVFEHNPIVGYVSEMDEIGERITHRLGWRSYEV